MNDDDLIRRGDARKAMADYHWNRYASRAEGGTLSSPAVFTSHTWQDVQDVIRALPAVVPKVQVLDLDDEQITRAAKFMAMALWSELHEKAGEGVLPETLPKDAADVLCRLMQEKLSALAPQPAPEPRDVREAEPDNFDQLVADGIAEAMKAMRKFPQPNYVISKIAEEAGEVVKAAIHAAEGRETAENLRGEMKQLIAMLYRLWIEGDQVHGLGSVALALIDKEAAR